MRLILAFAAGIFIGILLGQTGWISFSSAVRSNGDSVSQDILGGFVASGVNLFALGVTASAQSHGPSSATLRFPVSGAIRMLKNGETPAPTSLQTVPNVPVVTSNLGQHDTVRNATQPVAPPAPKTEKGLGVPPSGQQPILADSKKQSNQVKPDPAAVYARAFNGYEAGRYAAAREQFQNFRRIFPSHGLAPNAQYWIGETLYAERRLEEAARAFEMVVRLYPRHAKCPDALLKLAYVAKRQGRPSQAKMYLDQLESGFPDSSAARLGRQARSALQGRNENAGAVANHG